ncbi:type IV secretory system conjugative DNA transfer family protein [Ruegeria sp. HKCCD7318]|uniref:type IV secretory system conjugative DNA transfer family protein n=1 Tax=Ruegeria sp. HKCCD7318 TaxID=2683014 RepID=UPI0014910449|nr:type IV secretory system conjugative DNA transfer family protein [Ruegeria sp. HKCCD7318]NOE36216.1 type IV secretory system conjugative DNA transfer family protein [Ruegeria sp. HKCCD7318]
MQRKVTYSQVTEARITFWGGLVGSLVICLVIHMVAPQFKHDDFLRLVLVVVFFGSLASATWSLTKPFADFTTAKMRWRYLDASPSVMQSVDRYLIRINRNMAKLGKLMTLGVGALGLAVLTDWALFSPLASLGTPLYWIGFGALAATPFALLFMSGQLREANVLRLQIAEEMEISGIKMRDASRVAEEKADEGREAVEITGPMAFRTGGYDWNVSDFFKNVAIFGQSGSGKTVCVLNALLDGLLGATAASGHPAAALILDPKGDFRDKIDVLAARHGRRRDLLIIDPDQPKTSMRWNPLDTDDDAQEVAGRFAAVMEILNPSGSDDAYWIGNTNRLVQNLISLFRFARPDEPPSLIEIYEAAMSDDKIKAWVKQIPEELRDSNVEILRTLDYFFDVWFALANDARSTVRSFVSNMLGTFLTPPYDTLFTGHSTARIGDVIDNGGILYVNMPIADKEVMARVVSTFIKLEFYREVLKRRDKSRPSFFLCDEFQSFFTTGQGRGDADAFERTRQSNHANIVAFQNLNALFKQTDRKEPVLNMLGNCAIKIFLRNTERETNEFASDLFGEHIETMAGASVSVAQGARGSGGGSSISNTAQYSARVKKDEFSNLGVPNREENSPFAEAIVHLAARTNVEMKKMRWKVHPIVER